MKVFRRTTHDDGSTTVRVFCPLHGMPDCSPLLNGCGLPTQIVEELTASAEEGARPYREALQAIVEDSEPESPAYIIAKRVLGEGEPT